MFLYHVALSFRGAVKVQIRLVNYVSLFEYTSTSFLKVYQAIHFFNQTLNQTTSSPHALLLIGKGYCCPLYAHKTD